MVFPSHSNHLHVLNRIKPKKIEQLCKRAIDVQL